MHSDIPDHAIAVIDKIDWPKCDLYDFGKLDIQDGIIYLNMYRQDGTMQAMLLDDTPMHRLYASWIQMTDRYTISETET